MLIDSFLEYLRVERNYSSKTLVSYKNDLRQFEDFFLRKDTELSWQAIDADVIRQWVMQMMAEKYTATSVNRKLSALRSFFRYLLLRKQIKSSPMMNVKGPKKKKPLPVFVKERDMDKLLDDVELIDFESVRDRMILEVFYETGIRLSELIGLDDADVDFGMSVIKVTGKRNKQRIIPFGEELAKDLMMYIQLRNEELPVRDSDALFVRTKSGKRMYPVLVYDLVKKSLSRVVALKKRSPHVLRHSFATSMLNHDANLEVVKELLGHESLAATEVYTHTTFEELKQVYKQAHPRAFKKGGLYGN